MNKPILIATKVLLTVAFLVLGVFYFWTRKEEFSNLHMPSAYAIFVVAVAFTMNVGLRSTYNLISARSLGASLSVSESFMLTAVVTSGNFILPAKVGAGIRALYMKKVHNFPISHFVGSAFIFLIVTIISVAFAALVLLIAIYVWLDYFRLDLILLFPATMILAVVAVVLLRSRGEDSESGSHSWFQAFRTSLAILLDEKRLLFAALVIAGLIFLSTSIALMVALREYAPDVAIVEAFLLSASQMIAGFITLTPGAAGFQELIGMYVGQSFAATMAQILTVLIWVRVVRIVASLILAVPSVWILKDRMKNAGA